MLDPVKGIGEIRIDVFANGNTFKINAKGLFLKQYTATKVSQKETQNIRQVQIQTFDNQTLVFYLAIRQRSKDLKHLIPRAGSSGKEG